MFWRFGPSFLYRFRCRFLIVFDRVDSVACETLFYRVRTVFNTFSKVSQAAENWTKERFFFVFVGLTTTYLYHDRFRFFFRFRWSDGGSKTKKKRPNIGPDENGKKNALSVSLEF